MPIDDLTGRWREILAEAYRDDPLCRDLMLRYRDKVAAIGATGDSLEDLSDVLRMHADLLLAVRAFVEGKKGSFVMPTELAMH